ncbi:unnamed protein product [Angiostrongylus costaricensis]|uniref:Uncharacterized protein n=1 Tax=Angiostrongylus costaricensis TaxID=334426 RepID=A0A0R3PEC1_ANGCS|nr:unnamed protein product [Angiostrongylus costaricensis]
MRSPKAHMFRKLHQPLLFSKMHLLSDRIAEFEFCGSSMLFGFYKPRKSICTDVDDVDDLLIDYGSIYRTQHKEGPVRAALAGLKHTDATDLPPLPPPPPSPPPPPPPPPPPSHRLRVARIDK